MLLFPLLVWGESQIVLYKSASYKNPLYLGDVAKILAKKDIAGYLRTIEIPQKYRNDGRIEKGEVVKVLRNHLIDPNRIKIVGDGVKLYSTAPLTKERLQKVIQAYIKSHYPDVEVERLMGLKELKQNGPYRIEIEPSSKTATHLYLRVWVIGKDGSKRRVSITALIHTFYQIPIAVHDIPKGSVLSPGDFRLERRATRGARYPKKENLIGSIAKTTIKAGRAIKEYAIEPDYAVKRRKSVKIIYQRGGIHIELLGLALQNGRIGDIVKVKNISTNKVLRCKVLQNGVVGFVY